ncbi:MAG: asparaginase [Rhodoferax sp.]|nr:asparaginase [Rhodoferax sp.]
MAEINRKTVVVLGTGGTIAGTASSPTDNVGYAAAQLGVDALLQGQGNWLLAMADLESEQVAQLDSKDMDFEVWRLLARRCVHHLARSEVCGIVITHGTDTMEETAFFLQRVLGSAGMGTKPVVLTGAMRPASSIAADGPQNLRDALTLALDDQATGVMLAFASVMHSAVNVRKTHTYRLDAFGSGDGGPLGYVEEGVVRWVRRAEQGGGDAGELARLLPRIVSSRAAFPRVELVASGAGADAFVVDALLQHGQATGTPVRGIVVAGTGNGAVHHALEAALARARDAGVAVVRASRCGDGRVLPRSDDTFADCGSLTPAKARIALMLSLLAAAAPSI